MYQHKCWYRTLIVLKLLERKLFLRHIRFIRLTVTTAPITLSDT